MRPETLIIALVVTMGLVAAWFASAANTECAARGARFVPTWNGVVCVREAP